MQRWIRLFMIGMIALIVQACDNNVIRYEPLGQDAKVLAFGDSITLGYGVGAQESYPYVLSELSGWQVINAGIGGETAEAANNRIDAAMVQHQPKLVLIELGGNDFLNNVEPSAVKENLRRIIRRVKRHNAIPVLIAIPALSSSMMVTTNIEDAPIYADLAREEEINVVPDVFSMLLRTPRYKKDLVHPNGEGYRVLGEAIYLQLHGMGLVH
ncbi:GDSL-type esterase/lipase family protein [Wohlfahrtiimonas sp. G9077]|uniref:GDSL-type esterase/lipase family protein n=1 Tax=Wohlfahrtiimonas sp. G9077 TaxID=1980118 RepID=UPI001F2B9A09|nr:GDSL-type esterase/lipase family protein [Wohlfahrtiimonas sp. G9077]